ncbi:hypothetical protein [Streptomyces lavendulae]|uniref:hypothetical protein n=1 Tax=Streptomyces lavendulae TaxID=1914 RepID=UPI002555854B|nr:hypothetical protein [Streptomyces lavendulae]
MRAPPTPAPAATCWPAVPVVAGSYSRSAGVYPVALAESAGTMLLSRPPTPGWDQAPSYHLRQEPGAILSAMGARATCAWNVFQPLPLSTIREP